MRPTTFDQSRADLHAAILAELRRLATGGRAPTITAWDARKADHLPSASYVRKLFGAWTKLAQAAGLHTQATIVRSGPTGLATEIDQHIANGGALASWMERYAVGLPVLDQPTRTEVVDGHTVGGQPCRIIREYWMVR